MTRHQETMRAETRAACLFPAFQRPPEPLWRYLPANQAWARARLWTRVPLPRPQHPPDRALAFPTSRALPGCLTRPPHVTASRERRAGGCSPACPPTQPLQMAAWPLSRPGAGTEGLPTGTARAAQHLGLTSSPTHPPWHRGDTHTHLVPAS